MWSVIPLQDTKQDFPVDVAISLVDVDSEEIKCQEDHV